MITIKPKKYNFINFLILDVPGKSDGVSISVGEAFVSDEDAGQYWDDLRQQWIEHVRELRAAGKESEGTK